MTEEGAQVFELLLCDLLPSLLKEIVILKNKLLKLITYLNLQDIIFGC
jgi:hypothetical protein